MISCCFSGHRPKGMFGYNREAYKPLFDQLQVIVKQLCEAGYTKFITGGAQGFDQLVFWAVDSLKNQYPEIQNIVFIPFEGQQLSWPKDTAFGQDEYNAMLQKADEVRVISDTSGVVALMNRNNAMLEYSDTLIALYEDDSWKNPETRGGTAQAIRRAMDKYENIMDVFQIVFNKETSAPYPILTLQTSVFR